MVVDDDEIHQFTTKMMLKLAGCLNVTGHVNPAVALSFLQTNQADREIMPDLILLDINMPIMDGFEFLEFMGESVTQNVPLVFMVSSSIHQDDIKKSYTYKQVKEYLSKPIDITVLSNRIEKHMG